MDTEIENKLKSGKIAAKRKKTIKKIIGFVIVFGLIIFAFFYYQSKKAQVNVPWKKSVTQNSEQLGFTISTVREELYKNNIDISGYVEPWDIQVVNFRSTGAITSMLVEEGDKVLKGQLLATIDDTQQKYNLASNENKIEKAKLTGNEGDLELLELQDKIFQTDLDYTNVTATFDGVVVSVNTEVGDYVSAGTKVMTIMDNSKLKATVEIDEIDMQNVTLDMKCNLLSDAIPGVELEGVVHYIPMVGEYSNQGIGIMKVVVEIDNFPEAMKPGFSFEGTLESDTEQKLLIVDQDAVSTISGQSYLSVKQVDGTFKDVEITAKYLGEGVCQILSGAVKDGDEVKIASSLSDSDSMKVGSIFAGSEEVKTPRPSAGNRKEPGNTN
ncbi:MAG: efflux RND transporter periplasmic adaptor subunit [Sphaerochaetaceae bacterium]|nr:efflux RND transporter periplasmic adaptor subunit [Sphaerochaetaceae bacterium]